jgi:hypothetical protein
MYVICRYGVKLRGEDDGHDYAVDGDDFAEDDGNEVLSSNSRCLDTTTDDGRAGDEDPPANVLETSTDSLCTRSQTYHAAPTTESPMQRAMPKLAHVYGDMLSRKAPT